jgi:hypothetical protein
VCFETLRLTLFFLGIPSLNVEPLQPMIVKAVKIDQGGESPVTVKLQFTNLKIYGIPQSSVLSFG